MATATLALAASLYPSDFIITPRTAQRLSVCSQHFICCSLFVVVCVAPQSASRALEIFSRSGEGVPPKVAGSNAAIYPRKKVLDFDRSYPSRAWQTSAFQKKHFFVKNSSGRKHWGFEYPSCLRCVCALRLAQLALDVITLQLLNSSRFERFIRHGLLLLSSNPPSS